MPVTASYRSGQAAKILGVSAHTLRRYAEAGIIEAEFTGSQWRYPVEEIHRWRREGLPPLPAIEEDSLRSGRSPQQIRRSETEGLLGPPSEDLVADAEDLRREELTLRKLRIQKQIEEEKDYFREREREEEDRETERQLQWQEQRRRQQREQAQLLEQERRQRWESEWVQRALDSIPFYAPKEVRPQVHKGVIATLARLNPTDSRRVVRELVEAATEKALRPWKRQKEIDKIIEGAVLYEIRHTDYQPKAVAAAAEAVSKLRPQATREELGLAAKEAIAPFIIRHRHEKKCEEIIRGVPSCLRGETADELEWAKEAVAKALKPLPIGCSEKLMKQARDRALMRVKHAIGEREEEARRKVEAAEALRRKQQQEAQRRREAEEAQRRKQEEENRRKREAEEVRRRAESRVLWKRGHVDDYLRKLGESKIEFESMFERWSIAEKLKKKIEPILIKELVQNTDLTDERIHNRIEKLVDEYLPEELDDEEPED